VIEVIPIENATWFRPCSDNMCVEVLAMDGRVFVRASENPERMLDLERAEWEQHLADVKAGRYDHI
jgi:hypothetical protein